MIASRHPLRTLLTILLIGTAVCASSLTTDAASAALRSAASMVASYESAACLVEVPLAVRDRVRCGYLTVPERREAGADPARTIQLPVAIVTSTAAEPAADPLIVPTSGGAGGTIAALEHFLDGADWATGQRDVVLIEQRGDELSKPTLACPELEIDRFVADGALLSGEQADTRRLGQIQRCHDRLVEAGVDLAAYTSAASAADIADLRLALGFPDWNLYGFSYGTRLALTAMRDQPDGLRSVILDGPYPPQINRYEAAPAAALGAVSALLARCEATERCRSAYPDLAVSLDDVLDRTAETPIVLDAKSPVDRSTLRVELSDTDLSAVIIDALSDPESTRILPFAIDRLAHGDDEAALPLVERQLTRAGTLAAGLELSVECAEEFPFTDDVRIQEALAADPLLAHVESRPLLRQECELWGVPPLGPGENAAVGSGIPVLITTGGLDPITPRAWADVAAAGLPQAFVVDFANMGHGAVWNSEFDGCAASVAAAFLRDPTVAPDAPCLGRAAVTPFLTTADIHPTSAIYRLDRDLVQDREPVQAAVAGILLLGLVGTLIYGIAYGLTWLARRRGRAPEGAVLAATIAAAANLAFVGALGLIMLRTDPGVLAFGMPAAAWPLVILPLVGVASTIVLLVFLVRAWIGGDGSTGHRVALSFASLVSIGFTVWLLARGLLLL